MLNRRLFIASATSAALLPQVVQARVLRLPSELVNEIGNLPGRIVLGSARPDATLIEFFDYNCGYCKRSATEVRPLIGADKNLRYILINYAILGAPSIEASRVALAASMQSIEGGYLALHEKLFALRGRVEATRALQVAEGLGVKRNKMIEDADSDRVTKALVAASQLGENLGLAATPSFIGGREGVVGYLDMEAKRRAIANLRKCEGLGC
jgi:protein-disulfide isomerase